MKPVVALLGRPNVGKSTLFNRLTKSRDALVANFPGLTRDIHYGHGKLGHKAFWALDTGGFEPFAKEGIFKEMANQTWMGLKEADVLILVVDFQSGLTAQDKAIADKLRGFSQPIFVAVNKAEGIEKPIARADFYALGLGEPFVISASHGDGVRHLIDRVLNDFCNHLPEDDSQKKLSLTVDFLHFDSQQENLNAIKNDENPDDSAVRVAIIGRPNVGKSTLTNALLGEKRVIAFDEPGTTRDAIAIDFHYKNQKYILVDTAGIRKKGKVVQTIEKFSVIKTLNAIEQAHVVILLLDAQRDIADQDAHLAGLILEAGKALVVAVNKWDALKEYDKTQIKERLKSKLAFLDFAPVHFISAAKHKGLKQLMESVDVVFQSANKKLPTPQVTRALQEALLKQSPARKNGVRPKPRYAHQGGSNPPVIVLHGNALENLTPAYLRYLEHHFRSVFDLKGTPLKIECAFNQNPYAQKS